MSKEVQYRKIRLSWYACPPTCLHSFLSVQHSIIQPTAFLDGMIGMLFFKREGYSEFYQQTQTRIWSVAAVLDSRSISLPWRGKDSALAVGLIVLFCPSSAWRQTWLGGHSALTGESSVSAVVSLTDAWKWVEQTIWSPQQVSF